MFRTFCGCIAGADVSVHRNSKSFISKRYLSRSRTIHRVPGQGAWHGFLKIINRCHRGSDEIARWRPLAATFGKRLAKHLARNAKRREQRHDVMTTKSSDGEEQPDGAA